MSFFRKIKEVFTVPGTIVECKSGRFLAYYEHRGDIIANGDTEIEAKKNLKKMYDTIKKYEATEESGKLSLPPSSKTKSFTEKLSRV